MHISATSQNLLKDTFRECKDIQKLQIFFGRISLNQDILVTSYITEPCPVHTQTYAKGTPVVT
jgi:hypothetical protein